MTTSIQTIQGGTRLAFDWLRALRIPSSACMKPSPGPTAVRRATATTHPGTRPDRGGRLQDYPRYQRRHT